MSYIITYIVYILVFSILMGVSTCRLFKKMGYHPLFAFVPYYNYYIIQKEVKKPKWWIVFVYFPIVGVIVMSALHVFLVGKFGKKSTIDKLLTVFLPFIYMAYINYDKKTELPNDLDGEVSQGKKDGFVGSIVYAIVFATVIHTFVTQPFTIPTGSMERTLLVGDFLFVNKWSYGYRMPMRPIALPFLQGTIFDAGKKGNPKDDPKSYLEAVKFPYLRIPGLGKVKKHDIVVFNYPQDSVHVATDRKDPYVKRCVAVAGDVLEMRAGRLFVNGKPEQLLGDQENQHSYSVKMSQEIDEKELWNKFGYMPLGLVSENDYLYQFQGLTNKALENIKSLPEFVSAQEVIDVKGQKTISYFDGLKKKIDTTQSIFPINKDWNADWYGPIRIPKKGDVITLNQDSLPEYRWIISEYEHNKLENKNGEIYINGKKTNRYQIQQDYYFMMGDNRDASLDARYFGFVPEQNIIGSPMFTWLSLQGVFDEGPKKIRWERMFKLTNTGEANKTSYTWLAVVVLVLFFGWEYIMKFFKKKDK